MGEKTLEYRPDPDSNEGKKYKVFYKIMMLQQELKDATSEGQRKDIQAEIKRQQKYLKSLGGSKPKTIPNYDYTKKEKPPYKLLNKGGSVRKGHTDRRKGLFYK